jgi:DNA invertase Pin-like site-specific DNA recombinase
LDRLSREEILPAHTLFLSIVQAGINLVTLTDKRVYRAKTTNLVDMITSLVIMERAHEESKTKSMRVGAAWKNKRSKAVAGQPMTARCPAWLQPSADRKSYEVIPERVELIREIFADTAAGIGMFSIATRLNKAGVPAFVGKKGWKIVRCKNARKPCRSRRVPATRESRRAADSRWRADSGLLPSHYF